MTGYVTVVTADPQDDAALTEALEAHQRRRPREQRIRAFDPARWCVWAAPGRTYRVPALRGWRRRLAGLEAGLLDVRYPARRAADTRAATGEGR